jgi:prolyl oligopeptidase
LGTEQKDDQLVFDGSEKETRISFFTEKNILFVIEINKEGTQRTFYYADISSSNFKLEKFIEDAQNFKFLSCHDGKIYYSSRDYNWGDVRYFSLINNEDRKLVIPQLYNNLLMETHFNDDYIICKYKNLGNNYFILYDYNGTFVKKIDVPNGMDVEYEYYDEETKDFYFGVYSYVLPFRNFKINIVTGKQEPFFSYSNRAKELLFPLGYFETKTTTYKSRDNIDIPITIIYKKGTLLHGNNPTLLEAYGGFGVVSKPSYDTGLLYFLEKGGVFAYPEIRGGGEKGPKWHLDGMNLTKMNTFNDFIDAAEFLIKEKYTSPNKLGITGASQGGLLVGVAMTKRPDLFKVVIPKVGLFDMAKFQNYTTGKYWLDEYGNPEKENEYRNLLSFSPFHNIDENINYPTTLIITSDNDDRVPPLHSYKFAAKLQNRAAQKNQIYLKTIKNAGHYGDNSTYEKRLRESAEFYSFLMYHLNQ